jgi:hypothetical protein
MKYGELTLGQVEAIVNKLGGMDGVRRFLTGALMVKSNNIYTVFVDYEMSVEELVRLGHYDWVNNNITSAHFPVQRRGKAKVAVELINFDRSIGFEETLSEMDKMDYRSAEIRELLTFGAKYQDVQREFPIIAFGSVWRHPGGSRYVLCLYGDGSGRGLFLYELKDDWHKYYRFAAIRK